MNLRWSAAPRARRLPTFNLCKPLTHNLRAGGVSFPPFFLLGRAPYKNAGLKPGLYKDADEEAEASFGAEKAAALLPHSKSFKAQGELEADGTKCQRRVPVAPGAGDEGLLVDW